LAPNWVLIDWLWVRSSARAAPTGSSDGVRMRCPVEICCWVLTMPDCSSESREMPVAYEREQHAEQGAGRLDQLAGCLVGLLVAQEIGGLFIEVDAGFRLL
jgi:hypothetical protein